MTIQRPGHDYTSQMDFKTVHSVATTACPKCGAELTPGAKFCGECGTAVAAAPKPLCAGCGAELHGAKFCPQCGQSVAWIDSDHLLPAPDSTGAGTGRPA